MYLLKAANLIPAAVIVNDTILPKWLAQRVGW